MLENTNKLDIFQLSCHQRKAVYIHYLLWIIELHGKLYEVHLAGLLPVHIDHIHRIVYATWM